MSIPYRNDIDGLRAIAVISILLFHADSDLLPGGFVGVDVFFVISGYLITSLIKKQLTETGFSFRQFYLRRIRRLLPSLVLVMLVTWCAGFLFLSDTQFVELAETALSSTFFTSNWYFLSKSNYFDSALETNALLHTWSLSIEEQFYLLWPMALVVLHRVFKNNLKPQSAIITLLLFSSFMLGLYQINYSGLQNAFFNTIGRIWELFCGGLVALTLSRTVISSIVAELMRIVGLGCLFLAFFTYQKAMVFPGVSALLPVIGTCLLLLASNSKQGLFYKVLTLTPVRFTGSISYSLYLWHWPLLVYANIVWSSPTNTETLVILLVAVLLAIISTRYLENPVRYKKVLQSNAQLLAASGSAMLMLTLLILSTILFKGFPERWNYQNVDIQSVKYDFTDAFNVGSCFVDERHDVSVLYNSGCLRPVEGKKNMLIIGDSFAAQLMPGLEYHFPEIHFNQATASSCRALHGFAAKFNNKKWPCGSLNRLVFSRSFLAAQEYSAIILVSDWQYRDAGTHDGYALLKTIRRLETETDVPIIVLGNTPVYKRDTTIALRSHLLTGYTVNDNLRFRDGLLEMEQFNINNIEPSVFISLLDDFCKNNVCPILTPNKKMVNFGHHLTEWGAIEIIGASKNKFNNIFMLLENY